MTLSQSYPSSYPSFLYPPNSTPSTVNEQILPKISDSSLGGNSIDYQSKLVGGRRSRRNRRRSNCRSRKFGGRRYLKKRTQKHKKK
jgi:hypothetical protein